MAAEQMMFIICVIYASLSLGVLLKFTQSGLKGSPLWLAPFVPFLVFIVPIIVLVLIDTKVAVEKFGKKSTWQKIKAMNIAFSITLRSMPFLTGLVTEVIKLVISAKRKSDFMHDAMPYVRDIYHEAAMA